MFPNPQDALPLPPRPHLEQYKKQAKDLVKACKSGDANAIHAWAERWVQTLTALSHLTITPELPVRIDRWIEQVETFARKKQSSESAKCALADAQFVIARSHGFESWPKFAKHVEGLARANSDISNFESAADAIVAGDITTLERLLREDPALVRAHSTREHWATLLHYVSANGVEGYRQRTAKNVTRVAEILLKAGAEVDAEAAVYGGGATTLRLVATSIHPERAGVQEELMEILLRYGAGMDHPSKDRPSEDRQAGDRRAGDGGSIVNACLANGRGGSAEFLARRGARLNLEAAAGMGRLEIVKSFFKADGSLQMNATQEQKERGLLWACEYGRNGVIEFLLQNGADTQARSNTGQTSLHWAVIGGQLETIRLLLARGAALEAKNAYGGTALGQALWSAINGEPRGDDLILPIIETLIEAGAKIEDSSMAWLARQEGGSSAMKQRIADVLRRHGAKS